MHFSRLAAVLAESTYSDRAVFPGAAGLTRSVTTVTNARRFPYLPDSGVRMMRAWAMPAEQVSPEHE